MVELYKLLDYFRKIQKLVLNQGDFTFISNRLVKKSRVDDLLCCIQAELPQKYKDAMKCNRTARYPSMGCYQRMIDMLTVPFFFNKKYYIVPHKEINNTIMLILGYIENDIARIEMD